MQEELAVAVGLVPEPACLDVLGDGGADEPGLAVADVGIRLSELDVPVAGRLHLGASQDYARLEALDELVVASRAAVLRDQLRPVLLGHRGSVGARACPPSSFA